MTQTTSTSATSTQATATLATSTLATSTQATATLARSTQYDDTDPAYVPVLDHGFVYLVDHMGSDAAIVQAARLSYA